MEAKNVIADLTVAKCETVVWHETKNGAVEKKNTRKIAVNSQPKWQKNSVQQWNPFLADSRVRFQLLDENMIRFHFGLRRNCAVKKGRFGVFFFYQWDESNKSNNMFFGEKEPNKKRIHYQQTNKQQCVEHRQGKILVCMQRCNIWADRCIVWI